MDPSPHSGPSMPSHLSLDQLLAVQPHPLASLSNVQPFLPPAPARVSPLCWPRPSTDLLGGGHRARLLPGVARVGLVHVPGQWVFTIRHLQGAITLTGHSLEIVADLVPGGGTEAGAITPRATCLCPLEAARLISRNFPPPSNLPQLPQESACLWALG